MGSFTYSLLLLFAVQAAGAQAVAPQRVAGAVVRPGVRRMDSVPDLWVTLHRVGRDRQGPLDSMKTDARGRYAFRYAKTGSDDALYFVSTTYRGIAYFTPPLQSPDVRGLDAEITVFDTTSRHVPISVRGHHIVVSAVDANAMRSVVEVYDLVNDSSVTRVAKEGPQRGAVWSAEMIPGATKPSVREGDFPSEAVSFERGRASLFAPFAPGLKQLAFTYFLPAAAFPVRLEAAEPSELLEVLLEEKNGTAAGNGLKEVDPVTVDGRNFRRFLSTNSAAGALSTIDLPRPEPSQMSPYLIALVLALGGVMAAVLANALRRR